MCRAQGIPHIRVASPAELRIALNSAWGLNRHSVVELVTDRAANVAWHREVQASARQAVARALGVLRPGRAAFSALSLSPAGVVQPGPVGQAEAGLLSPAAAAAALPAVSSCEFVIGSASYEPYSLRLARPLTTAAGACEHRRGLVLRIELHAPGEGADSVGSSAAAAAAAVGSGDVAPLPGLHIESLGAAERQLAALCEVLPGARVPATLATLHGRLSEWLETCVGVGVATLHPSVRCGLEGAVLSALAQVRPACTPTAGGARSGAGWVAALEPRSWRLASGPPVELSVSL
jgi:isochorismate synthase/2-succinyl-5-enolpyruvyl-6-hydroxy-3-cyclohexene-1-carboxylate synthase/2-succinyl-6-hydroxy-2,4-cyclohexadiene-1-carboxylate synthase/O-succinylbenzoate synthase